MRSDQPSQTAFVTALLRALHLAVDDQPAVFNDTEAIRLLPAYQRRYVRRLSQLPSRWIRAFRLRRSGLTQMRAQVVVRARFAEDVLEQMRREQRCHRLLVLAAGLDTFALRQRNDESPVEVVEIDHPATQRWKADWLSNHGHTGLPGLHFLPVDFERSSLGGALEQVKPATQVISWLGTTYYLTRNALAETLRALATHSRPGSRLVLDFWQPMTPDLSGALLLGTRLATALQAEPMKTFLKPEQMAVLLGENGWRVIESLDATCQGRRYLADRSDGLEVPSFAHLVQAEKV